MKSAMPGNVKPPKNVKPLNGSGRRSRTTIKRAIKSAIQEDKFFRENSCVDVSDGFEGSIHIVIVSDKFDEMSERVRQGHVSKAIEKAGLSSDEEDLITLVFAASPKELK